MSIVARGRQTGDGAWEKNSEHTLLTIAETAERLVVSARTVRRLIKRGELVAHRLGRNIIRVDAESVAHLLVASRIEHYHGVRSWHAANGETTPPTFPISSASEAQENFGTGSSTARRSRLARPTPSPPNTDSTSWPQSAAMLREHLKRLRRPC